MIKELTDDELRGLLPTVTLRGQKPVPMAWLKQPDALIAMRNVERLKNEEIAALKEQIEMLHTRVRMTRLTYGGVE